jgi:hypothetical protein
VKPASRIDEDAVAAPRFSGGDGVEHDSRRIRAFAGPHDIDAGTIGPDLQLIDRGGAKGIGGADQRTSALGLDLIRELPHRGRFAGAVDADDQHHVRSAAVGHRPFGISEDAKDLLLHQVAQTLTAAGPAAYGLDDVVGGGHSNVGHDQQFLERFERVDVDGARSLLRGIGALDKRLEALGELLRRTREALLQFVEKTHYC